MENWYTMIRGMLRELKRNKKKLLVNNFTCIDGVNLV